MHPVPSAQFHQLFFTLTLAVSCSKHYDSMIQTAEQFQDKTHLRLSVAQTVKNLPSVQETQVQSLIWKGSLERKWLLTPVFLPGKSHE